MNKKKLLGQRIKELRKQHKFTQEQLGEIINIEASSLGNIENGYNYPLVSTLEKLANALDCYISDFFDFEHSSEDYLLVEQINQMLKENPDKIKKVYKIIRALIY